MATTSPAKPLYERAFVRHTVASDIGGYGDVEIRIHADALQSPEPEVSIKFLSQGVDHPRGDVYVSMFAADLDDLVEALTHAIHAGRMAGVIPPPENRRTTVARRTGEAPPPNTAPTPNDTWRATPSDAIPRRAARPRIAFYLARLEAYACTERQITAARAFLVRGARMKRLAAAWQCVCVLVGLPKAEY